MNAEIVSVQVGAIQTHQMADDRPWKTAYFKQPVPGAVYLGELALAGDEQKHRKFHGGVHRSLLGYSAGHYALWQQELGRDLPYGAFAENLTISGLHEDNVCIGDVYSIGAEVRVQVSAPREPCNQIDKCWQLPGLHHTVTQLMRVGWYMRTLQTGMIAAGMPMTLVERTAPQWTIRAAYGALKQRTRQPEPARALSQLAALEPSWQARLAASLSQP